jgi:uncharacterized membrane protein
MFENTPSHVTNSISFVFYLSILATITIAGMILGYPGAIWVWAAFILLGWDSGGCNCDKCTKKEPSASDIISKKYANGEISDREIDEKIDRIERIKQTDDRELENILN